MNDSLKMFLIALVTAVAVQLLLGPYLMRLQGFVLRGAQQPAMGPVEAGRVPLAPVVQKLAAPNLDGLTVEEARDRFRDKGIEIVEDAEQPDPTAKPRTILQQRPAAGAELTTNEIHVVVAKAQQEVQVPNAVGMQLDNARDVLVEAGFEVPDPQQQAAEEQPGTVIKQVPNPGAKAKVGSIVRLVISQAAAVEVPKVTSKYLRAARKALEDAGLAVGSVRRVEHPEHGENFVLSQEPAAGESVPPNTEVDLVVVAPN